jgi:glutaredoxin 3
LRILIAIVLLALIGAGALFVLSGSPGTERPSGLSATLEELATRVVLRAGTGEAPGKTPEEAGGERGLLRWFASGDGAPTASVRDVYYQYVDESGTVHFVQKLEDVPVQWREKAGRIEVERSFAPPGRQATRPATERRPVAEAKARVSRPEVVVYTTSWCGWCRKTLAFLDERGVDYVNKDIEANEWHRDELIQKTGRTSIPVVEIDGQLIRGYNAARMEELLARSS